tara:strand:- start:30 stop:476 length:447 start_codon:yes stop_codon:yes gene_type:complete
MPKVVAIYLRPARGEEPVEVSQAKAVPGLGLEGDHFSKAGGHRQITLLSLTAWKQVCQELGVDLPASVRRANIVIDDIDLKDKRGRFLKIGRCLIQIRGETTPCRIMDEAHPGLKDALKPDWRGGVYGSVASGSLIMQGDTVIWSSGL